MPAAQTDDPALLPQEAATWRARAEAAERRVKVLEASLADIHERIMRTLVEIREAGE